MSKDEKDDQEQSERFIEEAPEPSEEARDAFEDAVKSLVEDCELKRNKVVH